MKNHENPPTKPSIIEPPQLELKLSSLHLCYIFLCEKNTLPIIIADDLFPLQVEVLKSIVKKFFWDIRWTIADIIRITLDIFSYKIKLEVDHVHSVEQQQRLNPPMQKVIKKDIMKWIYASVIYLISNSTWVSLV